MSQKKGQNDAASLLRILRKKSQRGTDYAKRTMLKQEINSEVIREALQYYTSSWELLAHPAAFSIACEAVGGDPGKIIKAQAAIVMVSAALDSHDDVIDRSKVKHGRQTVVGKYGQDIALLLGNAFFVNAFALLAKSASMLTTEEMDETFQVLKKGLSEVGDAHALELQFRQRTHRDPAVYMELLRMKAAITEATMLLGAMFGGGTDEEVKTLGRYGRILGTLAALREEFIDIFEKQELCHRVRHECLPVPILYALQGKDGGKIEQMLSKQRISNRDIERILDLTMHSVQVRRLKEQMMSMIEEAHQLECEIENRNSRNLLAALVSSMLENL